MGTFGGHTFLGPPYWLLGMWYIIQALRRLHKSRIQGIKFKATFAYPADFLRGRWRNAPIDSVSKVLLPTGYIFTELIYGYTQKCPEEGHMNNWQHVTISVPLIFSGVAELLIHYGVPIIPDWDYVANGCFFLVEAMTFYFHLHGSALEIRLHVLMLLAVLLGLFAVTMEARVRGHVMLPIIRGTSLILKGTWLTEIGFILYNPNHGSRWNEHLHSNQTLATVHFSWHVILCLSLSLITSAVVATAYRRKGYAFGRLSEMSSDHMPLKTDDYEEQAVTPCLYDTSDREQD